MPQFSPLARVALLCCALAVAPAAAVADQTDNAMFDLTIKGFRAGALSFDGTETAGVYAVTGKLQSSGLMALVKKIRFDASASGTVRRGIFTPDRYEEKADTGQRQSESVMDYKDGVPQVKVYNPPRPPREAAVDPATQGGTVDPLTALYAVLRDVPLDQACTTKVRMFDGRHSSQLALAPARVTGDKITCDGEYRRLAGFSDKEMAEKTQFPFRLTYEPAGNGMVRVVSVSMDSLYGKASLKRR